MYGIVLATMLTTGTAAPDFFHHGCHGCHGCCGCYGCCGCWGYGCNGCCGGYGCNGYSCGGYGCNGFGCCGTNGAAAPAVEEKKEEKKNDNNNDNDDNNQQVKAKTARVIVSLPADAKLTINGQATKSTSAKRVFESPTLEQGKTYVYTFNATIVRDGQSVSAERKIKVKAGERTPVSFDFEDSTVARK